MSVTFVLVRLSSSSDNSEVSSIFVADRLSVSRAVNLHTHLETLTRSWLRAREHFYYLSRLCFCSLSFISSIHFVLVRVADDSDIYQLQFEYNVAATVDSGLSIKAAIEVGACVKCPSWK